MPRHLIPSDKSIKAIKAGDVRRRLSDGDGLYLLLFVKGGSHGWRLDYTFAARRKTLSLGTYPDTGLALARQKADEARVLLAQGVDPSNVRKANRQVAASDREAERRITLGLPPADSFEAVAREWLDRIHAAKVSAGHAERGRIRLEQDVFPWLGTRPIATIAGPEVLECLRRVEGRGAIETAHRIKQICGQVFRYGVATGRCDRDPTGDLRDALTPIVERHHAALTQPADVGGLLRAIDAYRGQPATVAALKLGPLVFVRPGELRHAEWAEIDLDGAMWTIPSTKMKRSKANKAHGDDHLVPLSRQVSAPI